MEDYELAIIGAGPGGYVAALSAAIKGLKTVLIEQDKLGGVCLNSGCIPTKFLLSASRVFQEIKGSEKWGITLSNLELNYELLCKKKEEIVTSLSNGIKFLLEKRKVEVILGHAKICSPSLIEIETIHGVKTIKAKNIIIATGSQPLDLPNIKFDDNYILSSQQVLNLDYLPTSLLIIGGGVIAVELATHFVRLGSEVIIVEIEDQILPREEKEIARTLATSLKKKGVKIYNSSALKQITKTKSSLIAELDNGRKLEVEKVLLAVSRKANTSGLFENLEVKMEKGFLVVDDYLRTSLPNIYAIGDVIGKFMLAHTASYEAHIAVANIIGQERKPDYSAVPSCIFSEPEIATVGLKEEEARNKGYDVIVAKFPFRALGKIRTMQEGEEGFIKLVAERKNKLILGAHLIGPHVTEIINELSMAIKFKIPYTEITHLIHPHPTIGEAVLEAVDILNNEPIHFLS